MSREPTDENMSPAISYYSDSVDNLSLLAQRGPDSKTRDMAKVIVDAHMSYRDRLVEERNKVVYERTQPGPHPVTYGLMHPDMFDTSITKEYAKAVGYVHETAHKYCAMDLPN